MGAPPITATGAESLRVLSGADHRLLVSCTLTELYFFDGHGCDFADGLPPSARSELLEDIAFPQG